MIRNSRNTCRKHILLVNVCDVVIARLGLAFTMFRRSILVYFQKPEYCVVTVLYDMV